MAQYAPRSVTLLLSDYDCIVTLRNSLSVCGRRTYRLKHKPDSPPRTDRCRRSGLLQFFPQPSDMRINDIGARIEVHVPNLVVKLTSRDRFAGPKHQVFEKFQLH